MTERSSTASTPGTVLTVARGMSVLRAFQSDRAPLTNAELVRRTGLSKAAVSRFTSTLLQLGLIKHVPASRQFELAPGPLAIGHAYVTSSELLRIAHPAMQALADRINASVALATRDDLDILYVGYRASTKIGTLRLGVGSVVPMGTTAIGHAYLWALPKSEQAQLIARLKRQAGRQAPVVERSIRESFSDLDRTGTCAVLGGYQRDNIGIALPVFVGRQGKLMSLSCGRADANHSLLAERRRVAPLLQKTAEQFQELLSDIEA